MEINKVQWRMIAKGEKLPCDSFLMKKDGTIPSVISSAGVEIGQDAYYLPVEELRSFPKEESEDERIRKELIAEVKEKIDCIPVPDCRDKEDEKALKQLNKWLAWLEKQGEQILANSAKTCKDEQKPTEEYNITGIKSKHAQGKLGEMIKRKLEMEKQGEQKHTELPKGEDYGIDSLWHAQRILEKTLGKVEGYQSDDGILEHKCAIEAVNRLYEQKSAWSKEDEMMMMFCCDYLDDNQKSWLLSLKDRVHPQPKQGWSEEDELNIRELERLVKQVWATAEHENDKDTIHKMSDLSFFLKTLKPQPKQEWSEEDEYHKRQILRILKANGCSQTLQERTEKWIEERLKSIRPQNIWRPSDEQMEALKYSTYCPNEQMSKVLFELYQDLDKLRG